MAKRKPTGGYEDGVIYELRMDDGTPFYVGESSNSSVRKMQHRQATNKEAQRLVYDFTAELDRLGIEWDLHIVDTYGNEGPTDKEAEAIIKLLQADIKLTNMRRGNANWMENYIALAKEMKIAGFTSPAKYKEHKKAQTAAERLAKAEQKQAEWLAEQEKAERIEKLKVAARQATIENNKRIEAEIEARRKAVVKLTAEEKEANRLREIELMQAYEARAEENKKAMAIYEDKVIQQEKERKYQNKINETFDDGYKNIFNVLFERTGK
jgi:hypothetical protein